MFTVKLIEPNGHEQIFETAVVWAEPVPDGAHCGALSQMNVFARQSNDKDPDKHPLQFGGTGFLYVMNEAGQTVAKYFLGNRETEELAAKAA
jgi:hypothetical protein